jgi:hypothetical protein
MNRISCTFAALAATAIMLSTTIPAIAAEETVATDVSAKSSPIKRRHIASTRQVPFVTPLQHNLRCSGEWCGRQFVLIVGIGY